MLYEWGNNIHTALSNDQIFTKDCDTQKFIIRNHYPSVYEDLHSLISANHTNNLTRPIETIYAPPTHLKLVDTLSKYFHRYKDYLELISYLNNYSATIGDQDELNTFILGANQCFEFSRRSHEEIHSNYKKKRHKYSQGHIFTTLTTFED